MQLTKEGKMMDVRFTDRAQLASYIYETLGLITDPHVSWEMVYDATPGTLGLTGRYEDITGEELERIMRQVWEKLELGDWPFEDRDVRD